MRDAVRRSPHPDPFVRVLRTGTVARKIVDTIPWPAIMAFAAVNMAKSVPVMIPRAHLGDSALRMRSGTRAVEMSSVYGLEEF